MENTPTPPRADSKRLRLTESERVHHVASWKRSGHSAAAYAKAHGLRASNLYAWSSKAGTTAPARSPFVPVRIGPAGTHSGTAARIILRKADLECVIEGAENAESFAALAAALRREVFDV